jgi:hypothetical protein
MRKIMVVSVLALAAAFVTNVEARKAAKTTKQVMAEAHKGKPPLCGKASTGMATKEEAETLVVLYTDMANDKPKKGDADDWKKRCQALVDASKALAKDPKNKDAVAAYKAAVACKGCHDSFK